MPEPLEPVRGPGDTPALQREHAPALASESWESMLQANLIDLQVMHHLPQYQ